MWTRTRVAAVLGVLLATSQSALAQQIEWSQTLNLPKGLNLPQGVRGDILGIELGETYGQVKARIEAIHQETKAREDEKKIFQDEKVFRLPLPSGGFVNASYVGGITLSISSQHSETVEVHFSAPSSGHQVIGVKRGIVYTKQSDQIRISELVASLKAKFKGEPQFYRLGAASVWYVFQFDDGRMHNPPRPDMNACSPQGIGDHTAASVQQINASGVCDVMRRVEITTGISGDHASMVVFWLSDNERAKKNVGADFAFFNNYVKSLQQRTGGAAPKL